MGVIALVCGFSTLARDRQISPTNRLGQAYLLTTLITAVTALGIYQQGGFGRPHVLAVLTLIALAVGTVASGSVRVVSYSSTILFHLIPAVAETSTRLPPHAPLIASQEAPILRVIYLVILVIFLVSVTIQVRSLRKS